MPERPCERGNWQFLKTTRIGSRQLHETPAGSRLQQECEAMDDKIHAMIFCSISHGSFCSAYDLVALCAGTGISLGLAFSKGKRLLAPCAPCTDYGSACNKLSGPLGLHEPRCTHQCECVGVVPIFDNMTHISMPGGFRGQNMQLHTQGRKHRTLQKEMSATAQILNNSWQLLWPYGL